MSGAPIISGHEPVAEAADQRRHHHEEHHDEAVAGHEHVEGLRVGEELHAGLLQLHAHGDRERAADDAGHEAEDEVQRADVLVVRRQEPPAPEGRDVIVVIRVSGVSCVCHDETSVVLLEITVRSASLSGAGPSCEAYFCFASVSQAAYCCSLTTRMVIGM